MTKLFEKSESGEVTQEYVSELVIEFARRSASSQINSGTGEIVSRNGANTQSSRPIPSETPAGIVMKPL
jgi:hypothetical protein